MKKLKTADQVLKEVGSFYSDLSHLPYLEQAIRRAYYATEDGVSDIIKENEALYDDLHRLSKRVTEYESRCQRKIDNLHKHYADIIRKIKQAKDKKERDAI